MRLSIIGDPIDWAATGTMLQGWSTLAGVFAVIWAAHKGASTFDQWRKQKITERKQSQAERILTATYKARRALSFVRHTAMWANELTEAEAGLSKLDWWSTVSTATQERWTLAEAYFNRIRRTKDEQEELDQCLPMARALFGEELERALEELNRQFWIVRVDVGSYIDDEGELDPEFSAKIRLSMHDSPSHLGFVNEVSEAIVTNVATIERICLPVLRLEI